MSKIKRNMLFSVIFIIGAFFIIQDFGKQSAHNKYYTYFQEEQKKYESVYIDDKVVSNNNFTHNTPYFSLNVPFGIFLIKTLDNNGIVGYIGETDTIMCQVQVIDTYILTNMRAKNIERRMFDYNMYSKESLEAAYNGLVKSTVVSSPYGDVINVVHSVQNIMNKIFIYIKYEIPDDDESMIRESYNFLINGYTITVVGLYFKNDRNAKTTIENFLKSIRFN